MNKQGTILKFTGHGDGTIAVETINPALRLVAHDEITASATSDITRILVQTIGGARACYVFALYDGCWHFSVRQIEEGHRIPNNWEITIDQDADVGEYTTRLTVDAFKLAGDVLDKPRRIDHDYHLPRGSS